MYNSHRISLTFYLQPIQHSGSEDHQYIIAINFEISLISTVCWLPTDTHPKFSLWATTEQILTMAWSSRSKQESLSVMELSAAELQV